MKIHTTLVPMPKWNPKVHEDRLIEAASNAIIFIVSGSGDFPLDMLRYDTCWPATERDVLVIGYSDARVVELRGMKAPTASRWESFGWEVL